jgi:hypothetical protein
MPGLVAAEPGTQPAAADTAGIAQQGREAHAKRHDMMFGFNVARQ